MWFWRCTKRTQRHSVTGLIIVVFSLLLIGAFRRDSKAKSSLLEAHVQFKPTEPSVNAFESLLTTSTEDMANSEETPSNKTHETWLDTEKIVQDVLDELKGVGWTGFNKSLHSHIRHFKLPGPRRPANIKKQAVKDQKTEMSGVLAASERWKVVHVGCFYESGTTTALLLLRTEAPKVVKSVLECVRLCARTTNRYASVSAGKFCRCGRSVSASVLGVFAVPEKCNMKCEEQPDRRCGGDKYASVYQIVKHSLDYLTTESIDQSSAGCFIKPKSLDLYFKVNVIKKNPNSAECLLRCERANFAIASWERSGVCRCGKFTQKFPLGAMGSKVDNSFCNKKCNGDKMACGIEYVRIMRTYSMDDRCEDRRFLPSKTDHLVALASFPGSGNTWTRYLIESATGIYSGSVYADQVIYNDGFIGERLAENSGRTSVVKSHFFDDKHVKMFQEAILVIRNPYDAILAEFNRIRGGHTGYAEIEMFNTMEWIFFVALNAAKWFSTIEQYSSLENYLIIYFEDMTADPVREVRKMVDFLNYPVPNVEERFACLEGSLSGDFKRQKKKIPFDPFLQKSKDIVNLCITTARKLLESIDAPPLPKYER